MREAEKAKKLPGPNKAGSDKTKVRSASAEAFRIKMNQNDPTLLRDVTRAIYPVLHPALQARYIFTYTEDIA
eukprot:CAMPEP_0197340590 /NCGR_PEP_ID=MMETSP0892-20130614/45753_1 /TAXON_ID=44058 ORGANISM="Aureoumbra lagunensis, Strain CCMP1510" /NCGR_SAMPLE_ID=MMETSP0892 /ASSEMBLY_ACC=CAM_ASM_000538 /LENGTH=71 /DNA_ID=CAMNT_0042845347 /DNA_START=1200 /DNA_END=1411 /DNA_ORIENTATION=+